MQEQDVILYLLPESLDVEHLLADGQYTTTSCIVLPTSPHTTTTSSLLPFLVVNTVLIIEVSQEVTVPLVHQLVICSIIFSPPLPG